MGHAHNLASLQRPLPPRGRTPPAVHGAGPESADHRPPNTAPHGTFFAPDDTHTSRVPPTPPAACRPPPSRSHTPAPPFRPAASHSPHNPPTTTSSFSSFHYILISLKYNQSRNVERLSAVSIMCWLPAPPPFASDASLNVVMTWRLASWERTSSSVALGEPSSLTSRTNVLTASSSADVGLIGLAVMVCSCCGSQPACFSDHRLLRICSQTVPSLLYSNPSPCASRK